MPMAAALGPKQTWQIASAWFLPWHQSSCAGTNIDPVQMILRVWHQFGHSIIHIKCPSVQPSLSLLTHCTEKSNRLSNCWGSGSFLAECKVSVPTPNLHRLRWQPQSLVRGPPEVLRHKTTVFHQFHYHGASHQICWSIFSKRLLAIAVADFTWAHWHWNWWEKHAGAEAGVHHLETSSTACVHMYIYV